MKLSPEEIEAGYKELMRDADEDKSGDVKSGIQSLVNAIGKGAVVNIFAYNVVGEEPEPFRVSVDGTQFIIYIQAVENGRY